MKYFSVSDLLDRIYLRFLTNLPIKIYFFYRRFIIFLNVKKSVNVWEAPSGIKELIGKTG